MCCGIKVVLTKTGFFPQDDSSRIINASTRLYQETALEYDKSRINPLGSIARKKIPCANPNHSTSYVPALNPNLSHRHQHSMAIDIDGQTDGLMPRQTSEVNQKGLKPVDILSP